MTNQQVLMSLKGISPEEYNYLQQLIAPMSEEQVRSFVMFYSSKRKDPQDILLFTLLGFIVVAGVQRFVLGQIGMGVLYLLTGGLCLIGTIVDLINHKSLTLEHNQKEAFTCAQMIRGGYGPHLG